MVCAISATSSSVVTKGGQICSVLLWMVRISTPACGARVGDRVAGHVVAQLHAGHERGTGAHVGHQVVGAQRVELLLQHGLQVSGALDEVFLLDHVEVGLGDHARGRMSGVGEAVPEHRRVTVRAGRRRTGPRPGARPAPRPGARTRR